VQDLDLQVAGVHFFVSQTHLALHAVLVQQLPVQVVVFALVPLPAIAAMDINMAVVAIKI